MAKARKNDQIIFNEAEIRLYQDLSPITQRQCRALRPLLTQLRARIIVYKWCFPFYLFATYQGCLCNLHTLEGLPDFCTQLQLEPIHLPDWQ